MPSKSKHHVPISLMLLSFACSPAAWGGETPSDQEVHGGHAAQFSMSVTADQSMYYPLQQFLALPDEHQTFFPMPRSRPSLGPAGYYVVAAMINDVNNTTNGWTFLLNTQDLLNLSLVQGAGDPSRGAAIFWPPHDMLKGQSGCNYSGVTHFDDQYAAPGTVIQDPTQPPGNFIMVYESEIHCPPSPGGGGAGWVSIGIAHSKKPTIDTRDARDLANAQWPEPVAAPGFENNWLDYGNGRYAALTIPGTPIVTGIYDSFYGDSLPSAFLDDVHPFGDKYLYILYCSEAKGHTSWVPTNKIHIARAKLGERNHDRTPAKLEFWKWYNGGWNAKGEQSTFAEVQDDGIDPPGCNAPDTVAATGQISYNEALGLYMLVYNCVRFDCSVTPCTEADSSWYFRTTRDLDTQIWSTPQLIENSTHPILTTTDSNNNVHHVMDGGYPTFMSPACRPGHIGLTGYAFLLNGDGLGPRVYERRKFTIAPGDMPVRPACEAEYGPPEG